MDRLSTIVFLLSTGTVAIAAVSLECPASLTNDRFLRHFGDHCYQFILNHHGDWFHADSDCRGKGGYLVDIHSPSEQAFIFNSLQFLGLHGDKGVWIGLTDKDKEGTWKWTSGTNVNFRLWARGQPGLLGGPEDCALLDMSSGGTWHDYPCHGFLLTRQNHGWICKFAEIPFTKSESTVTQTMTSTMNTNQPSTELSTSITSSKLMSSIMPTTANVMSTVKMSSAGQSSAVNTFMSSSPTESMTSSTRVPTMLSTTKLMTSSTREPITSSTASHTKMSSAMMSSSPINLMTSTETTKLQTSSSTRNSMMSSTMKVAMVSSQMTDKTMSTQDMTTIFSSPSATEMQTSTMKLVTSK